MSSPEYYRAEAARCRELAGATPDAAMALRWRQLASEYEMLALSMESEAPPPAASRVQSQPMQQQQAKAKDDED